MGVNLSLDQYSFILNLFLSSINSALMELIACLRVFNFFSQVPFPEFLQPQSMKSADKYVQLSQEQELSTTIEKQ